jgi:hypothetical protein
VVEQVAADAGGLVDSGQLDRASPAVAEVGGQVEQARDADDGADPLGRPVGDVA